MFKKFITILIICFMLINFFIPINAFALDMTLDNNYIKGLIATTLVSSGLVFNTAESLNDTVEKVKLKIIEGGLNNHFPKEPEDPDPNLNDIIRALFATAGTMIFNAVDQTYQTLVGVPQWFWEFIKHYTDDNYDVGPNIDYSALGLDGFSNGFGYKLRIDKLGQHKISVKISINDRGFFEISTGEVYQDYLIDVHILKINSIEHAFDTRAKVNFDIQYKHNINGNISYSSYNTYDKYIEYVPYEYDIENLSNINGTPGILDNPEYDWNNNKTNDKTILLPVESDFNGNPVIDINGFPQVNLDNNFMVNTQPSTIPQQNIEGSPYTPPDSTPIDDPSVFQGQNIGLLQGITNLLSQIGSFLFNLPNLLFDVPSDLTLDFDNLKLNGFQDRFPFSIPWDIAAAIGVFSSSPTEPDLTIDMDTNYFSLNHEIDISAISLPLRFARYAASVFFVLYLANKTRDLIKW